MIFKATVQQWQDLLGWTIMPRLKEIFVSIVICLAFCGKTFSQSSDLENTVWMFGKPNPEESCQLIVDCECCLSQVLFMENGECIWINPCYDGGELYTKGKYTVSGKSIRIQTSTWSLVKKTIWGPNVDVLGEPENQIKKVESEADELNYFLNECQGSDYLVDERDGMLSAGKKQLLPTAFQFYQLLKKEGVWEPLMGFSPKENSVPEEH